MKKKNDKENITSSEMALVVLDMIKKMSDSFYRELIPKIEKSGIKLDEARKALFIEEVIIINFWIVSKALSPDKKMLDELHKIYLHWRSFLIKTEADSEIKEFIKKEEEKLNKRYKEYYKHFDAKAEFVLALAMLENMINPKGLEKKKLTDIRLMFYISSYVFETIKTVLDLRRAIRITDI